MGSNSSLKWKLALCRGSWLPSEFICWQVAQNERTHGKGPRNCDICGYIGATTRKRCSILYSQDLLPVQFKFEAIKPSTLNL